MAKMEIRPILTAKEFEKAYLEYRALFVERACRYVRDEEVAADIVSDSFMAFWEHRHAVPADTNIPAYVFATIKNRCLNHLRDQSLHLRAEQKLHSDRCRLIDADIASLTACDPDKLFQSEILDIMEKTLAALPARTRQIYLRSRVDDCNYNQIAAEFAISFSSVDKEIRRSLRELRAALKDYIKIAIPLVLCILRN